MANTIEEINKLDKIYHNSTSVDNDTVLLFLENPVVTKYIYQKLCQEFKVDWFLTLKKVGAFDLQNIPKPIILLNENGEERKGFIRWNACLVIWEASKNNAEKKDEQLTSVLITLIDDYIRFTFENKTNPDRNFTSDFYFCQAILLLPDLKLNEKYYNFIVDFGLSESYSLLSQDLTDKFFHKAIKDKNKDLIYSFLKIIFTPNDTKDLYKLTSKVDLYFINSFVLNIPEKLFNFLKTDVLNWAIQRLETLGNEHPNQFKKNNIISLEPDKQNSFSKGLNFAIVDFVIGLLKQVDKSTIEELIDNYLKSELAIIKRIAFFMVDLNYDLLNHLFWKEDNPLNFNEGKLEIYRLINRHSSAVDLSKIKVFIEWIDNINVQYFETENEKTEFLSYQKVEWLLSFENEFEKYSILKDLYNENKVKTKGQQPNHPGYDSYFESFIGDDFEITNKIRFLNVIDLVKWLNDNKETNLINRWGVEKAIKDYVIQNFELVIKDLTIFNNLPINLLYDFIDGFRTLSENNVSFDVIKLYEFILNFLKSNPEIYIKEKNGVDNTTSLGMIAWLIDDVLESKSLNISLDLINCGNKILLSIEENYSLPFELPNDNPLFDVTNSTRGKLYKALISSSLKELKVANKSSGYWNDAIKARFTERANKVELRYEFLWIVGFMTPQISYLNLPWLENNVSPLFRYNEALKYNPAFYGYLLGSGQLYRDLFKLLHECYDNEIDNLTERKSETQKLIEHVLIAFVAGFDNSSELLNKVLTLHNAEQITYLVNRINIDDGFILQHSDKLLYIWRVLMSIDTNSKAYRLKSALANTILFIDKFNLPTEKELKLFESALKLADNNTKLWGLIDTLKDNIEKNYDKNYTVVLKLLLQSPSITTAFEFSTINDILVILYEKGEKLIANEIAHLLVEKSNFDSIAIYNKYNT